jgi:hypothetical protein
LSQDAGIGQRIDRSEEIFNVKFVMTTAAGLLNQAANPLISFAGCGFFRMAGTVLTEMW